MCCVFWTCTQLTILHFRLQHAGSRNVEQLLKYIL